MDVLTTLQFLTVFLITLSAACAVGHALELPGKLKLSRDVYLAVQPIYYPVFTRAFLGVAALMLLVAAINAG